MQSRGVELGLHECRAGVYIQSGLHVGKRSDGRTEQIHTKNWEIFATNNIRDFRELTSLANCFVANTPAHVPKCRYRQCMVRLVKFLVAMEPIREIYCSRIVSDLGYTLAIPYIQESLSIAVGTTEPNR